MDSEPNAPLERSASQLSTTSASARGPRSHSTRAKSKPRKLISQPSSSASSVATSDKSLTSFPSFSPQSPRNEHSFGTLESHTQTVNIENKPPPPPAAPVSNRLSIVDSLTSTKNSNETNKTARNALFDDTPVATQKIPGALHHADDDHIERLIAKHGAVNLVRQIAEDLAHRDHEIARLRRRADERERALRKIILGCGLSSLDLETKLRSVEAELKAQDKIKCALSGDVSGMMSDAMHDSMSYNALGINEANNGTVRASGLSAPRDNYTNKGTMKAWKEYLWGGTSKKTSRAGSINEDIARTVIRASTPGDRRPALQDDLFTPPDVDSVQSSSRTSSIYSGHTTKKPSASFASMALQLVAGKASSVRDSDSVRGRSNSAGQGGSVRSSSNASTKTGISNRAVSSTQGGPKALMSMRRGTPKPINAQYPRPRDRWEGPGTNADSSTADRPDNYGPVEMDTIFSPEGQPPALSQLYNNYNNGEYLIDRFGFIYDQRRKKRQREANQVALQMKKGHEMLSGGRSNLSPNLLDNDESGSIRTIENDSRPESPTSIEGPSDQIRPKRWQDYLKIATFPTELLSHTPSITASGIEVLEGNDQPKSPALVNPDDRGFVPPAGTTTSAPAREASPRQEEESAIATLVHEDVEPVKLLLKQLSDVHDNLQREKSIRWNEFLRKVRAERRREGEAAAANAAAAAEARFQIAPVMIPEAKLTDGETIGIADLGVKGKVGRAKWNEFRNLVLGGIPVVNRPKIWAECSGALSKRTPGYYKDLVSRPSEADDAIVISQIEMDINRTLTDNIFFRKGPGVAKLNEVLRAYARHNPEVGYCQGMNLIAANLLLIMPSAEDAFWVFVSIIERILPAGYYDHSLMASRADQHVLRQYVSEVLPKLSQHLDMLSIELEALTFQWFLSVFTDCLSAEALFRVWDVVLCINDGSTFLFQVALALLKLNERQLLLCDTPAAIYTYINHQMTNHAISIDGLIQASEGLRRVVRREDVEERRNRAIEADRQSMREREERGALRRAQSQNQSQGLVQSQSQKSLLSPAVITETSVSALPSPAAGPIIRQDSVTGLSALDATGGEEGQEHNASILSIRPPMPMEEEAAFGLG